MIGRYRLVRKLGRGGMGTVWLAEDGGGRPVAVKVINDELAREPEFRERFRQEVEAARRVRRFCTAPVLDAGLDQNPLWVATDFIDGPTVREAVSAHGPLRGADLDALAVGIATALSAIHQARLIHRDLKPANVLLSPVGPRVIDFGIARALDATGQLTRTGTVIGTPGYIAPELLAGGRPLPAADVFSWGPSSPTRARAVPRSPGPAAPRSTTGFSTPSPIWPALSPIFANSSLVPSPRIPPPGRPFRSSSPSSPARRPPRRRGLDPHTRRLTTRIDSPAARRLARYAGLGAAALAAAGAAALALVLALAADGGKAGAGGEGRATTLSSPSTSATPSAASMSPPPATTPAPDTPPSAQSPLSSPGPITNTASGLCIDTDGPQGSGVHVQVRKCGNFSGQEWSHDPTTHHLANPPSGLCLDTAGAPAKGVRAVLNRCGNYTGQQWRYDPGTGRFRNLESGLCLDTDGPPANYVELVLNRCGNYTGQGWHG
ncbi:serine/threonine protein kinase [Actinomadura sp. KC216]|uniref:serine/threonine protein kinase n=1 Tax=Actinomadura sp. KC216 TaxID=2530370 RepID=UPI001FB81BDD|nr:serine/threonine protein kinase [Actinomadura sp. KC216]